MDYKSLNKIHNISERRISEYLKSNNFERAIRWMSVRSDLLYELNCSIYDELIESNLEKVFVAKTNQSLPDNIQTTNRIVFVDVVSKDRRGLSNQYVNGLIENGTEFLYITENRLFKQTEIYQQIQQYEMASYCIVPSFKKCTDKVGFIYEKIIQYAPRKVLCHLLPWSITMLVALAALPKSIIKININITDHAFWAGLSVMDYNIEFRNYGKELSVQNRGFQESQEFVLPYYPYIDSSPFEGFSGIETKDKVVLFFGGALYKIYGEDDFFLKLIAKVLKKHNNCVCICAGGGDSEHLLSFIKNEGLDRVWHYIGFRKDIYEVVRHCDILINTYPIGGGLMCQYAAMCSKPVIAFAKAKAIEEVLSTSENVTFLKECDFLDFIELLISDKSFREKYGKKLNANLPTPLKFNSSLKLILDKCCSSYSGSSHQFRSDISNNGVRTEYSCESVIIRNLGLSSVLYYPQIIFWAIKKIMNELVIKIGIYEIFYKKHF